MRAVSVLLATLVVSPTWPMLKTSPRACRLVLPSSIFLPICSWICVLQVRSDGMMQYYRVSGASALMWSSSYHLRPPWDKFSAPSSAPAPRTLPLAVHVTVAAVHTLGKAWIRVHGGAALGVPVTGQSHWASLNTCAQSMIVTIPEGANLLLFNSK